MLSIFCSLKERKKEKGNANINVETSPQLVTPRRSLFSSKRFGAELRRGKSDYFEGRDETWTLRKNLLCRRNDDDASSIILVAGNEHGHDGYVSITAQDSLYIDDSS